MWVWHVSRHAPVVCVNAIRTRALVSASAASACIHARMNARARLRFHSVTLGQLKSEKRSLQKQMSGDEDETLEEPHRQSITCVA